jgi:hypothetical protein
MPTYRQQTHRYVFIQLYDLLFGDLLRSTALQLRRKALQRDKSKRKIESCGK